MTRKKRKRQQNIRITPCFVFTPETITLVQKAIALLEKPLNRINHRDEKVAFAEETVQQVKAKLAIMKQSVGAMCLTTFDYNEKIIIRQSILLYSIDLLEATPGPKQTKELQQCRHIAMHFTD